MVDEVEKKDEEKFDKKTEFTKMMLGLAAGWIAKEGIESLFIRFVKRRQQGKDT